ncbi:MAG: T9SS type A sorting domain-containing protein [Bacteroidales bacterium]
MKKVLLVLSVACIVLSVSAQKYAFKNMRNLKAASIHAKADNGLSGPILPINKPNNAHNKSINGILIGTSGNAYTFIYDPNYQLDANPELNAIMHTHRAGGPWGGNSGDLRCKISYDFGQTWTDSVVFPFQTIQNTNHLYRYPNGIIYNPTGNTTPDSAFVLINGPITDGSGWNFMYFDSKKIDGSNPVINHITPLFTNGLERINLSGGNGKYYTMVTEDDGTWYINGQIRQINFDNTLKGFVPNPNVSVLTRNWKLRPFSNDTVQFNSNWNNIFDNDGLHGYAYCLGAEEEFDPYNETATPLLWETWDGGATWTTWHASGCWHTLSNLTDKIWPVRQSLIQYPNNPENWVYRPFFDGGSTVDENYSPAVIDYQGRIHILTTVSGMYSDHPDSLYYQYANQPVFLFDVYTTGQFDASGQPQWDVQFVDTLRTKVMQDANSPFTDGTDHIGWGHMLNIAISPDKKVVFAIWADTDPTFDSINTMPELKARAFNYETMRATPVINFTPGEGNMFFVNVSHSVLMDGNDYIIPLSYIDIYETSNPMSPQNHYFAQNLRITPAMFTETISASSGVNDIKAYNFSVSQNNPNPAKNNTEIAIELAENSNVNIVITNLMGQRVMEINKGMLTSGKHNISINTSSLSSGIYFYTVTANNNSITKKMVIE